MRARLTVGDSTPTFGSPASFTELLRYHGERVGQVAVLEGTSSFTETFLYRPDGSPLELLYQQAGQATARYSYIVDGQGNVVALTNSLGAVVDQYSYDLWGNLTSIDVSKGIAEGLPQPLRYHGYWYDGWYDGAGDGVRGIYASDDQRPLPWYWLGVRAYDPQLKRFLQPDPSAQDGVRSYIYCHDDPVNCTDPSGLAGGPIETPLPEGAGEPEPLLPPGEVLPATRPGGEVQLPLPFPDELAASSGATSDAAAIQPPLPLDEVATDAPTGVINTEDINQAVSNGEPTDLYNEGRKLTRRQKNKLRERAADKWESITGTRASDEGLEVHHEYPLEYAHLFEDHPNSIENLVSVEGAPHEDIHRAWTTFRNSFSDGEVQPSDVTAEVERLRAIYGDQMQRLSDWQ